MTYESSLTRAAVFFAASLILSGLHGGNVENLTLLALGLVNLGVGIVIGKRETR